MTRDDMKTIMKYFNVAYMNFYKGSSAEDVLNIWFDAFRNEDRKVVAEASKNYVRKNDFPPTIASLNKQIELIKRGATDTDLWAMIQKAVCNGLYGSVEEFEKLPPECQSFIGSPSGLKDLAQIEMGTLNTVVKGQFLKRVDAIREHQEIQRGLPSEVRAEIEKAQSIANGVELIEEGLLL